MSCKNAVMHLRKKCKNQVDLLAIASDFCYTNKVGKCSLKRSLTLGFAVAKARLHAAVGHENRTIMRTLTMKQCEMRKGIFNETIYHQT